MANSIAMAMAAFMGRRALLLLLVRTLAADDTPATRPLTSAACSVTGAWAVRASSNCSHKCRCAAAAALAHALGDAAAGTGPQRGGVALRRRRHLQASASTPCGAAHAHCCPALAPDRALGSTAAQGEGRRP